MNQLLHHIKIAFSSREKIGFVPFFLSVTLLYGNAVGVGEYCDVPLSGLWGVGVTVAQWSAIMLFTACLIGFLMVWRGVFAVAFPLLTLITAVALYFKLAMGISVTPLAVEATLINGPAIAMTMITWQLAAIGLAGLLLGGVVAWLRCTRVAQPRLPWLWFCILGVVTAMVGYTPRSLRSNLSVRAPWSVICSTAEYLANRQSYDEVRTAYDNVAATCATDSVTVVLILGESLRSDHLQINGYRRPTTPRLAREPNVVSLPNLRSEFYYTHRSIPHIVTRADSISPESAYEEPSFIPLFQNAGFHTSWITNQDYCPQYGEFMRRADTLVQYATTRTLYYYRKWLDTDMLPGIDSVLRHPSPKQLMVVHSIGSHWWYPSHYPDSLARFRPEVDSKILSELSVQQMINSYDNTILASDLFWSRVIDRLRRRRAVLVYVSDHGESLGEEGRLLHNPVGDEMGRIAAFVWMSDSYMAAFPEKVEALRRRARERCTTDVVFHTVLSAGAISTEVLNPELSLLND